MATKQNYLKKAELQREKKQKAGLMSDKYPRVSGIVINMTYYHNVANRVLMERMVNFFPTSYAYFKMECMTKGCEEGGFDLTSAIVKNIKQKKKTIKGKMVCKGKNGDHPYDHASISYDITIKYSRKKQSK